MLGGAGLDRGLLAVEACGILQILGLEALGDLLHGGAFLLPLPDELVINVGDVGDIDHLVAAVFQIAAQGVEYDQRAGVADVDIVVNGRAADIDAVFTGHLRDKFFFLTGQGVENLHTKPLLLCGRQKPQKQKAPKLCILQRLRRRFSFKSRFHFCLSLKAGNGGCRTAILSVPAVCSPGALHTRPCKQASSQRPVLSVQTLPVLLCPDQRICSVIQIYYTGPPRESQGGRKRFSCTRCAQLFPHFSLHLSRLVP